MSDKCDHVLDYEETHCVKCLKPVWLFDNENVLERIEKLEKELATQKRVNNHRINSLEHVRGDDLKGIAELKERIKEIDDILILITEGRQLELNAYERLESVLKEFSKHIISALLILRCPDDRIKGIENTIQKLSNDISRKESTTLLERWNKYMKKWHPEEKASGDDPNKCSECGGYRMGESMMHNDGCSQCISTTTVEKSPELVNTSEPYEPPNAGGIAYFKGIEWYAKPFYERKKRELIAEFLEKILAFNYAQNTEEQIIEIREWLEEMLK